MAYHGFYQPKFPAKYKGNPTRIVFRSMWERQVMVFFDIQPNILSWQSEEVALPYKDPVTGRLRRYFPDFLVEIKTKDGAVKTLIIEIKPASQTLPPVSSATNRQTRRFINEVHTYGVNLAKWKSAKAYCKAKGFEFVVWTEHDIPFI